MRSAVPMTTCFGPLPRCAPARHAGLRRRALALCLLLAVSLAQAGSAPAAGFVMGTDHDETSFAGQWIRRIYTEAFKRLGIPVRFVFYPTLRLSVMLERGDVDGEAWRALNYAAAHPDLVRVEEAAADGQFALYVANASVRLNRLEDLATTNLRAQYRRGVVVCENTLKKWQPADRLFDVTSTEQGLENLLQGPADFFHCDTELAVASALLSGKFRGVTRIRKLLVLSESAPLYPYLHRKNAELAPRLAGVLKQLKAEGLIARYRLDVEREFARK
jgi:polar amino acid transport system substrate-binding protein